MSGNMHTYVQRGIESQIADSLANVPVTAILGPRQCGKTTLARKIANSHLPKDVVYLDLERVSDQRRLVDAEWFLSRQASKLIVLDEIQRIPVGTVP